MSDLDARAFIRRPHGLVPADVMSEEWLATLPMNREVLVQARRARNPKHHRKLFALLRVVTENCDRWANEAVLLEDLKLATGLFETRVSAINGMPYPAARSISFAKMSQDEFEPWYAKAVEVLASVLGCSVAELEGEIAERTELRRAAA